MRGKSNLDRRALVAAGMLLGMVLSTTTHAARIHVDASVLDSGSGLSWPEALKDLQEALDMADPGDEIWVAAGCYAPSVLTDPLDERSRTFRLEAGVKMYGGFLGVELSLPERNPEVNITVLQGDPSCGAAPGSKAYHVVTAVVVGATTVLNGFQIAGGNADGSGLGMNSGGGMLIRDAGPLVVRCVFLDNRADFSGGAVRVETTNNGRDADPIFVNCSFFGNRQTNQVGDDPAKGGSALVLRFTATAQLIDCLFSGNVAHVQGCLHLGGLGDLGTQATVINCTISGNTVEEGTFAGIAGNGALTVANSILWGNADSTGTMDEAAQISHEFIGGASVTDTCIQGLALYTGFGNIDTDPQFADPDGADNTVGTVDDDLRLTEGTLCIDSANNGALPSKDIGDLNDDGSTSDPFALDLDLQDRIRHGTVDMGAYEFFCDGDIDDNGVVDVEDLLDLLGAWGPCPEPCPPTCVGDIDSDCTAGVTDLLIVLGNWCCGEGPGCPEFPTSFQECIDRYWPNIVRISACIEGVSMSGGL